MEFIDALKGYQRWGQILAIIAKLRWFQDNNYLMVFCNNYGYNYNEISIFLKVANNIIDGDVQLFFDLKNEYERIKRVDNFTDEDFKILNSFVAYN